MFCFFQSYPFCHSHTCSPNQIVHFCNALTFQIIDRFSDSICFILKIFLPNFLNIIQSSALPSTIASFNCSLIVRYSSLKSPSVLIPSPALFSFYYHCFHCYILLSTRFALDLSSTCLFIASNSGSNNQPFCLIALVWSHMHCSVALVWSHTRCSVASNIPLSLHSSNIFLPDRTAYFCKCIPPLPSSIHCSKLLW